MESASILAVDIGGTKLAAAIIDRDSAQISVSCVVPTKGDGAEGLYGTVEELLNGVIEKSGVKPVAIGVGCGGPMSQRGRLVSPLNIPQWREFALRDRLAERYELPTFLDNDAKALALGEGWVGAAQGRANYLALVVSTGVGGGIVIDGQLLNGDDGNAGHLGHIIVEPLGRECSCGARGCLEAEASGTAIAKATGSPAAVASIATRQRTGRLVGRALGSVCNTLDLSLCVAAGSVALGYGADFFDSAQAELDRLCRLDHSRGVRIVPSGGGNAGPLIGAAAVAISGLAA